MLYEQLDEILKPLITSNSVNNNFLPLKILQILNFKIKKLVFFDYTNFNSI